jgi:transcriptional regulator with XRE-family HTH domain
MGKTGNHASQLYKNDLPAAPVSSAPSFGDCLKHVMMVRSVSCKELAEQLFVSTSTITGYRSGRRRPDIDQVRVIAIALNVTSDYLLGIKPDPEKLFPDE